jgi:hypothetical protein
MDAPIAAHHLPQGSHSQEDPSNKRKEIVRVRSKTFVTFIILATLYASINLIAAPPQTSLQHYHVTSTTLRLANITVILPVIAIWFTGLYGYQKLQAYTRYVRDHKEGQRLMELSRGIMILVWWLPITSTLSAALNLYARWHSSFLAAATIFNNYLSLLFPLAAFWFISHGSRSLSELSRERPSQRNIHIMAAGLIVGSVLYGFLLANAREHLWTIYHTPLWIVMLTLAVPYVFTWYLGLTAAFDIHVYTRKVKGLIYRKGWNYLALGVVWIIVTIVVLQYVTAVSAKLSDMSLGWILALVYAILAIMAVGYVFIALGAKKLTKIEEA